MSEKTKSTIGYLSNKTAVVITTVSQHSWETIIDAV